MKKNQSIIDRTLEVANEIGGTVRESGRGVPHIVKTGSSGVMYSLCYFKKMKMWRVFWPWPSYNRKQYKRTFRQDDLIASIKEAEKPKQKLLT